MLVSELIRGLLQFSFWEPLLLEAGSWGRGEFGNPEKGECPPLKAATKQWLVETVTDCGHESESERVSEWVSERACVRASVCVCVRAQSRAVSKSSINPIILPNPVYSHSITWQYLHFSFSVSFSVVSRIGHTCTPIFLSLRGDTLLWTQNVFCRCVSFFNFWTNKQISRDLVWTLCHWRWPQPRNDKIILNNEFARS
jgi:hypothetical protein